MLKLFVSNLPGDTSEESLRNLFSEFGVVHSIRLNSDIFTGRCRGYGHVEMEGHEARAALSGLDGKSFGGKPLKIQFDKDRPAGRGRRPR